MKFRKKPVIVEATQWFKNGDHPLDYTEKNDGRQSPQYRRMENWDGDVVRRFKSHDGLPLSVHGLQNKCRQCGHRMSEHGWVDTLEGGHIVCPGDWIITGVQGEFYPCKPDIFEATYEPVEDAE